MDLDTKLRERCHINKNEGDRFVGIKSDSENATVCFPIGYQLPETDNEIRKDILHLISVLAEFTDKSGRSSTMNNFEAPLSVDFPIAAYMEIINCYLEQNSYYSEKEPILKTGGRGTIDWAKTIRKQRPLIQSDGSPIYTQYTVRVSSPNDKNLISQIHRYCVYESFRKLGWLFTPYLPPKPAIEKNTKMFLSVLGDKLARINNDKDKRLFSAMIAVLQYVDEQTNQKRFRFGTDTFEYVWEKLIDRVFGIKDKYKFFPRTKWRLKGKVKDNHALEPDTIMLCNGKIFILDAKYYRYGVTGKPIHLPASSSINKQITYGEYIYTQDRFKREYGDDIRVYNAFLMPYNSAENVFGLNSVYGNIGEARGDWKSNEHDYERVQGMVVDIRYLMYHYSGSHSDKIMRLANSIEQALRDNED